MRRLAFAAAVCGTLALAACSDQTPTEPTAPPPEEFISPRCRPTPHFPIVQVSGLITKVFPKGKLQLEALIRGAAIALFWETCKKPQAQKAAVAFVNFMNANSARLTGTQAQRNTLIRLILNGVGIPFITPPLGTADFGVGIFDPSNPNKTLIKTQNGTALVELEPGSFLEQTVIVISRRLDGSDPLIFEGNQFPPFWDYDAINASGNHVLEEGHPAIIAFCLLDTDFEDYPENRRIGHNPVLGAPGFPFEILEAVDLVEERPDLVAALNCGNLAPNTTVIGGFGQGLPGLANAAWSTARHYLAPAARALFLPEALHAATLALIKLPPAGGRGPSMSPFGVVEVADDAGVISNGTVSLGVNPEAQLNVFVGTDTVGLGFVPTGFDGIAHGCLCEGWGVAHPTSSVSGYANQSQSPQTANLTLESFARTATEATSVVRVGSTFRVTHRFRPIAVTPNLYEIGVTIENISNAALSGVVYRRVVDWDVEPTPFSEFVTIVRSASLTGVEANNNGFASADPLVSAGPPVADFFDLGPFDHGAVFDLTLSPIPAGGTNNFVIYYGAAASTFAARTALGAAGAEALSLARPNVEATDGTPNTFALGFSGLGGSPIPTPTGPSVMAAPPALRQIQPTGPDPRNR